MELWISVVCVLNAFKVQILIDGPCFYSPRSKSIAIELPVDSAAIVKDGHLGWGRDLYMPNCYLKNAPYMSLCYFHR